MAARLKVFTWSDGFHAFTVAATSRPKALAAWGVEQDLFQTGLAHEIDDGADRDAALASPGAVISRGLAVDVGKAVKRKARPDNEKARAKVRALEAELEAMDADQRSELQALEIRQSELDRKRDALTASHETSRRALTNRLKTARTESR